MSDRVDAAALRRLVPICNLTPENFARLSRTAQARRLAAGESLFRAGDRDNVTYYLLDGQLALQGVNGAQSLRAGTEDSRHPIANRQPRQVSAKAVTDVVYLRVDNDLLDVLMAWDQAATYVVDEIGDSAGLDNDWMTRILQSNLFQRVPPANIQQMFMRMEELPVRAGEVIIRQGEPGEYYYVVTAGQAEVKRRSPDGSREIRLALLGPGEGFGEEALIAESVRNATVAMVSDGRLVRLGQQDFNALLKEPVIEQLDFERARERVESGGQWIDVRLENEHESDRIEGSVNIPLYLLRLRAKRLEPDRPYVLYCDTGRRSAAAAYLLSARGFDVAILRGGLMSAGPDSAPGS